MGPDWLVEEDTPTYVYALFGGVVGMVVVTAHNLFVGAESYYSLSGAFVGSGVAGFLAANGSGHFKRAGMGAGVLGTVPAFAWSSDFLRGWVVTSASEGGPVFAVVLLCFFVLAIGTIALLIGAFGGFVGGWLAGKLDPELND
ncbi:DUF5518 domain-containing protein [Natronomonas gomsonensis]|uniref:DUF5518 domain-containing protein n=1 Tax=Natronomonas gomsonensis TaxID=1046043 RepID=UPI00227AF778|nr:DUF5518 domain-containing protein [Natronomonas gomsonensis]MCY4732567.1 DUF5518 domain-containing protein [Natronomonas gomsonensis]